MIFTSLFSPAHVSDNSVYQSLGIREYITWCHCYLVRFEPKISRFSFHFIDVKCLINFRSYGISENHVSFAGGILISSIVQSSRGNTIFIKGSVNLKDNKYYENTRVYC
uniref:rRNA-processing protein UTP23 n=1 Tax=Solanum tuberosum TaxID=4113 RepID=M1A4X2_SOLTU